MIHEKVYNFSKRYGPPLWDLRHAEIADEWGDDKYAQREIDHKVPEDVTREDFDYYTHIYIHMNLEDLFFYFYPIALEYEKDKTFDRVDSFISALNYKLPEKIDILTNEDLEALIEGFEWVFNLHDIKDEEWLNSFLGKELLSGR